MTESSLGGRKRPGMKLDEEQGRDRNPVVLSMFAPANSISAY